VSMGILSNDSSDPSEPDCSSSSPSTAHDPKLRDWARDVMTANMSKRVVTQCMEGALRTTIRIALIIGKNVGRKMGQTRTVAP
jgi:hypothetical protein